MAITSVRQALKLQCSCGRKPQFVVRHGHTRAQRTEVTCGLHLATALGTLVPVGDTAEVRVTVLR